MVLLSVALWASPELQRGASGYAMVRIAKGSFLMGSSGGHDDEKHVHTVRVSRDFFMGRTEVTQKLWKEVTGSSPFCSHFGRTALLGEKLPAQCVSWFDSLKFANALSERDGYEGCYDLDGPRLWPKGLNCTGYRLPTESEWEYAARGPGQGQKWSGTNNIQTICEIGNLKDLDNCEDKVPGLASVGRYRSNQSGLFDMTGNVAEWVWDRYGAYSYSKRGDSIQDPLGPEKGSRRGVRGGAWNIDPWKSQLSYRDYWRPEQARSNLGLRLVRTAEEP